MNRIVASQMVVPNIHLITLQAPAIARQIKPGQFVILRVEEQGERIPLSVSDWDVDQATLTAVFMNVGATTDKLASLREGADLPTVVGPLGNPTEIGQFGTVLCLGGCYGIGSIYPIARALKRENNRIIVVLEARSSFLFYWEEKLRQVADELVFISRDGTRGMKGHIHRLPEIIRSYQPVHRIIINGCTYLLMSGSEVSRPMGIKTMVSLNPIMIDGTGMCGVCRVSVGGTRKFACVDGPDFDGHQVNWEELAKRRQMYLPEETLSARISRCQAHALRR